MKVVAAYGSRDMIEATVHPVVHEIVALLLSQIKNQAFFKMVALFLKDNEKNTTSNFTKKLDALRGYGQSRPNSEGLFVSPPYVSQLVTKLEELYAQRQSKINFQRGAIVELLALNLVRSRYRENECFGNYRFVYERNSHSTDQIDVAILSKSRQLIEAYTCKIKPGSIQSEDCNNLTGLAKEATEQNYDIHTGAVSFDHSQKIEQRLKDFPGTEEIKAYGINNITKLADDPFIL
jgi:hypothetical protein